MIKLKGFGIECVMYFPKNIASFTHNNAQIVLIQ